MSQDTEVNKWCLRTLVWDARQLTEHRLLWPIISFVWGHRAELFKRKVAEFTTLLEDVAPGRSRIVFQVDKPGWGYETPQKSEGGAA